MSDKYAYLECFKRFAFVEFDLVADAYKFLVKCRGTQFTGSDRYVAAWPAVAPGPAGHWLYDEEWTTVPAWVTCLRELDEAAWTKLLE